MKCRELIEILEGLSPAMYACDWDNVGLLVGRREKEVSRVMIALDASRRTVEWAVEEKIDLLITHHPMIFSPLKRWTEDNFVADKALMLAENGICYYAMHTNFDAVGGMAELAAGPHFLKLSEVSPIEECGEPGIGMGRYGKLPEPMTASEAAEYIKKQFGLSFVLLYQDAEQSGRRFERIAVMPGSGKSDIRWVKEHGYDLFLTGDIGHHDGLDAMDMGMTVIDATHYGLEHIFVSFLSEYLDERVGDRIEIFEADMGSPVSVR